MPQGRQARNANKKGKQQRRWVPRAVSNTKGAFPDRFATRLKYSEVTALTPAGVGVPYVYLFRANSIYDPDYSGVGHQPLGRDELAAVYNKYCVRSFSYVITFSNQSTTDYADVAVVLRPNPSTISLMSTVLETINVKSGVVGPETGAKNILTIQGSMSIAALRGVSAAKVASENDFSALTGYNPVNQPTIQLYAENQNVAAAITVNARVTITYHVEYYDRKALTGS